MAAVEKIDVIAPASMPNSVKPVDAGSAGKQAFLAQAKPLSKDLQSNYDALGDAENAARLAHEKTADAIRGEANSTSSALVPEGSSDGLAKNDDMVSTSKTKTLTLSEQKALAAYCQYTLPKFYIPPLLVTDSSKKKQEQQKSEGGSELVGFIFVNIGDLKVEDATFPRNLPILKVPDADIDAVQDMGFGCGNIKISGRLWGEAGYARLQTLRELCKSRRPLIFISQETGPWYVMPQNVPGISTAADKPYQYFFDVTLVCVAQLNAEDPTIQQYAKMRRELVRKKFNREMAVIRAQNAIKERVKNFDTITGAGSGVQKGFYYDATNGTASYNPDLQELSSSDFASRTTGDGGMVNDESTKTSSSTYAESQEQKLKNINSNAKEIIARTDAAMGNAQQGNTSKDKNAGMLSNLLPGGGGRNEQTSAEKVNNVIPVSTPKLKPSENPNYDKGVKTAQQIVDDFKKGTRDKKAAQGSSLPPAGAVITPIGSTPIGGGAGR
jgi:hypothetical protein